MSHKSRALTHNDAGFHDPDNTGPRECPMMRDGGVFSIYSSCTIRAPPKAVYDAILDVQKWKEWNTFVTDVTITSHPHSHKKDLKMTDGTYMTFHSQMTPKERADSKEVCSHIGRLKTKEDHPPRVTRIRWDFHNAGYLAPAFVIKAQRVNEIEEAEDGTTLYRTWETFGGWAAKTIKKKYEEALKDNFARWSRDLKGYVEEQQRGDGAAQAVAEVGQAEAKPAREYTV
ncbi:hypothetical protein Tdes44962_MAKER06186 [Teratosphaeria destructans]|uniref:Polyketide cyclase/dehydrase n=1 Tax=Teratosphaeria destructans TaxID=418781 RepID=A0A9W7SI08_9PEZI|nr:hypothetical protein Tdes44962_MAKER06186 [Teratosphaeria destructans]